VIKPSSNILYLFLILFQSINLVPIEIKGFPLSYQNKGIRNPMKRVPFAKKDQNIGFFDIFHFEKQK